MGDTLRGMDRSWVDRLADDLAASRAELAGLAMLVVGGIVVAVVVVGGLSSRIATPGDGAPVAGPEDVDGSVGGAIVPSAAPTPTPGPVVVHVTGAVAAPAVLELPAGSRLVDAVDAAGGARGDAALEVLNLARPLVDGQRLHVPTTAEAAAAAPSDRASPDAVAAPPVTLDPGTGLPATAGTATPGVEAGATTADGLLDLNLATTDNLEELPGVGPVLAGRIVDWRDQHGAFEEVGQLRDVTGIGEARFQDLAPLVVVP